MLGDVSYLFDRIREDEIRQAIEEGAITGATAMEITEGGHRKTMVVKVWNEKLFVNFIATKPIKLPIWKVIAPGINEGLISHTGANYYIAQTDEAVYVFRGTYGYGGEGCHQSAFIEKAIKMLGLPIEERDADYLLTLFRLW